MVAARETWTRWAPLRVTSTRVFVPASTTLTSPVPALTCAEAPGSSAAAADRIDTPGNAALTGAADSSAPALALGLFPFMTLLLGGGVRQNALVRPPPGRPPRPA